MAPLTALFEATIKPVLLNAASLFFSYSPYSAITPSINLKMPALGPLQHTNAVTRCRRLHNFYFLDLPESIRCLIYMELFHDNTIDVCGFNKSHLGEYAENERCQILLTCKTVLREAWCYFYFYSKWKFTKVSSLIYFTWPDVCCTKWGNVTSITFTRAELLSYFMNFHVDKFPRLQRLVLDAPDEVRVRFPRRPKRAQYPAFVRTIISGHNYATLVGQHVCPQRKWRFYVVIRMQYADGGEEAGHNSTKAYTLSLTLLDHSH